MVAVANHKESDLFALIYTSDYANVARSLKFPKSKYGTCIDSGASNDYSPDQTKFTNYCKVKRDITTADKKILKVVGMGDLHLDLPKVKKNSSCI